MSVTTPKMNHLQPPGQTKMLQDVKDLGLALDERHLLHLDSLQYMQSTKNTQEAGPAEELVLSCTSYSQQSKDLLLPSEYRIDLERMQEVGRLLVDQH